MLRVLAVLAALFAPAQLGAQTQLLMAEEPGCYWCARWNEEIAPIYPKTAEGRAAPLRRFDILQPPADVTFKLRLSYTPTFVLVRDGEELGRIEGYPGEDFFWGLLSKLLEQGHVDIDIDVDTTG